MLQGPNTLISGTMTCIVLDNNGIQTTILAAGQPWRIDVSWTLSHAGLLVPPEIWRVRAFLEAMGPGNDLLASEVDVPVVINGTSYSASLPVAANVPSPSLPGPSSPSGLYKVVTVLTLFLPGMAGPGSHTTLPIAGYAEAPLIQFM
jgi:hypothetical protein